METQLNRGSYVAPDLKMAQLLGLTLEEYGQLSHSGIRAITDMSGQVMKYYIIISPLNPESIVQKIRMNKLRMVYFPYDAFDWKDLPVDEAV